MIILLWKRLILLKREGEYSQRRFKTGRMRDETAVFITKTSLAVRGFDSGEEVAVYC